LLTGDTLYPGNIYVKDWQAYVKTIGPLTEFVQSHRVKWLLGAHIEMDRLTHTLYPIGTEDLLELNNRLNQTQQAQQIVTQNWIVTPIGLAQRTLSKVARWIMQW
jgi:hypothetical protein